MELYLLRHGDALDAAPDDASRQLSPLGERQAHVAGRMLVRLSARPALILASPLVRAARTAAMTLPIAFMPSPPAMDAIVESTIACSAPAD